MELGLLINGLLLKQLRQSIGLSQVQLGDLANKEKQCISNIECGSINITIENLSEIVISMNFTMYDFYKGTTSVLAFIYQHYDIQGNTATLKIQFVKESPKPKNKNQNEKKQYQSPKQFQTSTIYRK